MYGRGTAPKERPGEPTSNGVASVSVEGWEMKGSWREIEAWHYVAGLESLKRIQERIFVKM